MSQWRRLARPIMTQSLPFLTEKLSGQLPKQPPSPLCHTCLASQAVSQPMRQVALIAASPHISRRKRSADSVRIDLPRRSTSFQFVWCASSCRPQSLLPNPGLNTRFTECSLSRLFSAGQSVTLCTVSSTTESYPSMGFDPLQGISLDLLCSPA